jgi:hypothetical protein
MNPNHKCAELGAVPPLFRLQGLELKTGTTAAVQTSTQELDVPTTTRIIPHRQK